MKPRFIAKVPGGFRIGKLEVFRIIGPSEFSVYRGLCKCLIVSVGFYGFTWLSSKYDCYKKADEYFS